MQLLPATNSLSKYMYAHMKVTQCKILHHGNITTTLSVMTVLSAVHHCVRLRMVWAAAVRQVRLPLVGQSSRLDDGVLFHSLYASPGNFRHSTDVRHSQRGQFDRRSIDLKLQLNLFEDIGLFTDYMYRYFFKWPRYSIYGKYHAVTN